MLWLRLVIMFRKFPRPLGVIRCTDSSIEVLIASDVCMTARVWRGGERLPCTRKALALAGLSAVGALSTTWSTDRRPRQAPVFAGAAARGVGV